MDKEINEILDATHAARTGRLSIPESIALLRAILNKVYDNAFQHGLDTQPKTPNPQPKTPNPKPKHDA